MAAPRPRIPRADIWATAIAFGAILLLGLMAQAAELAR